MSYNHYFYNRNFQGNTFHHFQNYIPPPPAPPPYFIPPITSQNTQQTDQEFIRQFEPSVTPKHNIKNNLILEVRSQLISATLALKCIKEKAKMITENVNIMPENEWKLIMNEILNKKHEISMLMSKINDKQLDTLRKLISKRSAKRMRVKRINVEKKRENAERKRELEEKSRKIDENLQKIKDDINKAKLEKQSKTEADVVLKEVLRKKHDAKKCIVKLDALMKLRKARQNTAKGRGANVSEMEADTFNNNLDKLKSIWTQKLAIYDAEEAELRAKLNQHSKEGNTNAQLNATERDIVNNLSAWKENLFGGELPQVDYGGDVGRFVVTRSHWDQFLSNEGTSIPIGWVLPIK